MQYNDHEPPHFHAVYGGERVMVFIDPPRVRGKIPAATRAKVIQWTKLRCDELLKIGSVHAIENGFMPLHLWSDVSGKNFPQTD